MHPVTMTRVALLAPAPALRDLLVRVADHGAVDFDGLSAPDDPAHLPDGSARACLQHLPAVTPPAPVLSAAPPDLERCASDGRLEILAGEAELERRAETVVRRGRICGLTGWMPADSVAALARRIAPLGGAVAPIPAPPGTEPPTQLSSAGATHPFTALVTTYQTVPYADLDPTLLAGAAYVVMFGMMFADVGQGALLLAFALAVRAGRLHRAARLRPVWAFVAWAGAASMAFGLLYGECFGPTGLVPTVWLAPLDHATLLLSVAVGVGAVFLAGAYTLGIVNRFAEGGWRRALYAPSGIAGAAVFLALALLSGGVLAANGRLVLTGVLLAAAGLGLAYLGLYTAAGGGGAGAAQAGVESLDMVVRIGSNLVSFARLAAFGLMHAALGYVVWQATTAAWRHGGVGWLVAAVVLVVGNTVAFALEGLVAAIQALRLEYYELFSRVFDAEGRPYAPWHIPVQEGT